MRLPKSFDTSEHWMRMSRHSATGKLITSEYIHQDGLKYLFAIICKSTLAECTHAVGTYKIASNCNPLISERWLVFRGFDALSSCLADFWQSTLPSTVWDFIYFRIFQMCTQPVVSSPHTHTPAAADQVLNYMPSEYRDWWRTHHFTKCNQLRAVPQPNYKTKLKSIKEKHHQI